MEFSINYLAVGAGAIAAMLVGGIWYGPLFGKSWIALMGFTPEKLAELRQKGMAIAYTGQFLGALLMVHVLAYMLAALAVGTVVQGFIVAFWLWLGFVVTVQLGSVLWEGKPVKLLFINATQNLATMLIASAILVLWK
jgi:hypothetical protein